MSLVKTATSSLRVVEIGDQIEVQQNGGRHRPIFDPLFRLDSIS